MFPESVPDEERFYTQPGWPLDKRNARTRVSPRSGGRLGFTLRDTPATIKTRAAVRLGLTAPELERFSEPFSATRVAMLTNVASDASPAAVSALLESLPGAELPVDARTRDVASRLASGDGFRAFGSTPSPAGTHAAAVAAAITPAEAAALASGADVSQLEGRVATLTALVDRYAGVAGKVSVDVHHALTDVCVACVACIVRWPAPHDPHAILLPCARHEPPVSNACPAPRPRGRMLPAA